MKPAQEGLSTQAHKLIFVQLPGEPRLLSGGCKNHVGGMTAGALAGAGWAATAIAVVALFDKKSWTYIAINGGHQIVSFITMGDILGAWR